MTPMHLPWLTLLTLLPLLGAAVALLARPVARGVALAAALGAVGMIAVIWHAFNPAQGGMQFEQWAPWLPQLGIYYHTGIDGLGLLMLALTAAVTLMAIAAAWRRFATEPLFFALVLALQAGLFGTFTALNFAHWFIFWELSLIPAFFLIRLWGGAGRSRAATQFFLYTMVGSVALLLAFLLLYLGTGQFDFVALARLAHQGQLEPLLAAHLH